MIRTFTHWARGVQPLAYCLILLILLGNIGTSKAQSGAAERITLDLEHVSLPGLLDQLSKQTHYHLVYVRSDLAGIVVGSFHVHGASVKEVLEELRKAVPSLEYTIMTSSIGFRLKGADQVKEPSVVSGPFITGRVTDVN